MHKLFYFIIFFFSVKPENVILLATNFGDKACQDDSVSLSCSADASPPVLSYQFFENDVLLGSNNSGMWTTSLSSNGEFIYRCDAKNLVGAANSANVSIYVGGTVTWGPLPFFPFWTPHISFSNSFTSSKKFIFYQFVREISDSLPHSCVNCVVSAEFHCAIITEETRITSKI